MNAVSFAATNDQDPDTGRVYDVSSSANFSVDLVRSAAEHFNDIESGRERHICVKAHALTQMLADPEVTSSDYVTVRALIHGELDTWMGFKWHVVGTRLEGGLPGVTTDEIAFAWEKNSIGLAIGIDMHTTIDWLPDRTSWVANGLFKAGAVAREPQGIVKLQYDETV